MQTKSIKPLQSGVLNPGSRKDLNGKCFLYARYSKKNAKICLKRLRSTTPSYSNENIPFTLTNWHLRNNI